jgi:hypothetical protein
MQCFRLRFAKKQLLLSVVVSSFAGTVVAQSAFEGLSAQVGIGYENDSLTSRSFTTSGATNGAPNGAVSGPSPIARLLPLTGLVNL